MTVIIVTALLTALPVSLPNALITDKKCITPVRKQTIASSNQRRMKVNGKIKMGTEKKHTADATKTPEEWKKILTPEQYRVMREKGTEAPFKGKYCETKVKGIYKCAACGNVLFESKTKFEAGCGWPSFYSPADAEGVKYHTDTSLGMTRTEVTCVKCGAHLGHVFDDGPEPTGKRYCINSVSLELVPDK